MTKKLSFEHIWTPIYALAMFLLVRSIAAYALSGLLLGLETRLPATLEAAVFVRDAAGKATAYTGNATAVISALSFGVGVLPLLPRAKRLIGEREEACRAGGKGRRSMGSCLAFGGAAAAAAVGLNLFLSGFAEQSESYQQVARAQHSASLPVALLCYGLLTPLAEELVFRGIIYNSLRKLLGAAGAALPAALVFGLYHGNAVQGIYGFLMSLLMIWGYERFGAFKAPVAIHMGANLIACCMPFL